MLIKLYYDLESCGIIIVHQVWYIMVSITRESDFSIIVFLSNYYSPRSFHCAWSLH